VGLYLEYLEYNKVSEVCKVAKNEFGKHCKLTLVAYTSPLLLVVITTAQVTCLKNGGRGAWVERGSSTINVQETGSESYHRDQR
jgi:hypothetical protein